MPHDIRSAWFKTLGQLALILALAVVVGLLVGQIWPVVTVAALGVASYEGHELTGVCPFPRLSVVSVTQQEREANPAIPSAWYVLEQTNIDDLVIWQDASGAVYQAMPGRAPEKISTTMAAYIAQKDE